MMKKRMKKKFSVIIFIIFFLNILISQNLVFCMSVSTKELTKKNKIQLQSKFKNEGINKFFVEKIDEEQKKLLSNKNISKKSVRDFFRGILKNNKVFEWVHTSGQKYIFYTDGIGGYLVEIEGFVIEKRMFFRLDTTYFQHGVRKSLDKEELQKNPERILEHLAKDYYFDLVEEKVIVRPIGLKGGMTTKSGKMSLLKPEKEENALNAFNELIRVIIQFVNSEAQRQMLTEGYYGRAMYYYHHGNMDNAINDFTSVIKIQENDVAYNNRGELYLEQNKIAEAKTDFEKALSMCAENEPYRSAIEANFAYTNGDYQTAINKYTQAIQNDQTNRSLYYLRGRAYEQLKDYNKAEQDYTQALQEEDQNVVPYQQAMQRLQQLKNYAVETIQAGIRTYQESNKYIVKLKERAETLAKAGKVQDAQNILIELGKKLEAKKEYKQAFEFYDRALKFSDTNAEAWFLKGMIFYKHQNLERALDMLNKALRYNSNYVEALLIRGKTFLVLEKFKEALEDFEKVLITDNTNKEAQHGKGISLLGLGGYAEALPIFDQLLNSGFRTEDMSIGKARALDGLMRYEEAADFYRRAGMLQAAEECLIRREIQENILKSRAMSLQEKTAIFRQAMQKDKEDDLLIAGKILTLILQNKDIEAFQECKLANNEGSSIQWICKALVYQKMKQHYNADKCFKNALVALEFEMKNKPYDQKKSQIKDLVIKAVQDRDREKYDVAFLLEQIILLYSTVNMAPEIYLEQKNNGESILQWTEDNITREYVLKAGVKIRGRVISDRYRGCEIRVGEDFEEFVDSKGRVMREESWSTTRLLGWVAKLNRPHLVRIEENEIENPRNILIHHEYDFKGNIIRTLRYEFLYDKYGRVIWETVYLLKNEKDTKGIFLRKIQRDYYSIGEMRLKKWRTFSSSPFPQNYPTYYICEQKMTEKFFTEDFKLLRESKYDEFGNTKEYCEYEYNGPIHTRYTYHLDASQRLETKTVATFIEEKPVEIAFYDAQGNLIDKKIFHDEATYTQITTAITSILGIDFIRFLLAETIKLLDNENIQKLCQKLGLPISQQTRENLAKIVNDTRHQPISSLVLLELFQEISIEIFKNTENILSQKEVKNKKLMQILSQYKDKWNIVFSSNKEEDDEDKVKGLLVQWDNDVPLKTYFPVNLMKALKEFDNENENKQQVELLIQELFEHEEEEHRQGGIQKHYRAFSIGLYEFTKEDFSAIGSDPLELLKLIDSSMTLQENDKAIEILNSMLEGGKLLEKEHIKTALQQNFYGRIIAERIQTCNDPRQKIHLSRLLLKILFPYQAPNSSKTLSVLLRFLQDNAMDSDISSYSIPDEELFERMQYQLFLKDRLQTFTENKIDGIEVVNPGLLSQNLSFEYSPIHTQEEVDKDQNPSTEFIDLKDGIYNIFMGGRNFSDTLVQFQLQTDEIIVDEYIKLQKVKEKTNYMRLYEKSGRYFVDYYVPEKVYTTGDIKSNIPFSEEKGKDGFKTYKINPSQRIFLKQLDTYNVQSCSIGIMFSNEEMPRTLIIGHFNNNTKLPYSLMLGELLKTKIIAQNTPLRFMGFLYPDVEEVEKFKNILSADVIVGDNSQKIPLPGESRLFIRSDEVYKMYPKDFRGHPVFSLLFLEGQPAIVAKYGHTLTTYSAALAGNSLGNPSSKYDSLTQTLIPKMASTRKEAIGILVAKFAEMSLQDKIITDTIVSEQYTFSMTPLNAVFSSLNKNTIIEKLNKVDKISSKEELNQVWRDIVILQNLERKENQSVFNLEIVNRFPNIIKALQAFQKKPAIITEENKSGELFAKYADQLSEYRKNKLIGQEKIIVFSDGIVLWEAFNGSEIIDRRMLECPFGKNIKVSQLKWVQWKIEKCLNMLLSTSKVENLGSSIGNLIDKIFTLKYDTLTGYDIDSLVSILSAV